MKAVLLTITLMLGAGCAPTFHAVNGMDAAQTMDHKNNRCVIEGDPLTRRVLGREPEPAETLLYFGGVSLLYEWARRHYEDRGWWQPLSAVLTIAKAGAVAKNYDLHSRRCFRDG